MTDYQKKRITLMRKQNIGYAKTISQPIRMYFASIIMPSYGKRRRKATAILPLMPQ